jgi:hypothetical protein
MKKVIVGLIVFCIMLVVGLSYAGSAANSYSVGGNAKWGAPDDITVYTLDSANYKTDDTIGATYCNYYGPFMVSPDPSRPSFKGFRVLTPKGTLNATCTLSVEYQLVQGKGIADTGVSKFTAFDSIKAAAGSAGTYVDISSKAGAGIVFKLKCLAEGSTAVMSKAVKVIMKANSSETVDTKH